MTDLLFLAHRIPYPPNKGDKVRSYHLLKYLAERYRVYLGAFVDDNDDWQHAEKLQHLCAQTCLVPLNPLRAKLRSVLGLLTPEALTLAHYRDPTMAAWVRRVLARGTVDRILVFSSAMAQYLPNALDLHRPASAVASYRESASAAEAGTADAAVRSSPAPQLAASGANVGAPAQAGARTAPLRAVVDFVDVDSDKWRQYAERKPWPASWVYRRESRTMLAFERRVAATVDASVFVSAAEAELFRRLAPEVSDRTTHVNNGVDLAFFSPERDYANPYPAGHEVVVFTGAMDYWANVEAVTWFAREVLPLVRQRRPAASFYIVGARPPDSVRKLESIAGVHVTGTVADVRPYLAHALVAVAPLRIARGVQNKVLEAMAMARPVVATSAALEGIEPAPTPGTLRVDGAVAMAEQVLWCLAEPAAAIAVGAAGRAAVAQHYDWTTNLSRFSALLEGDLDHEEDVNHEGHKGHEDGLDKEASKNLSVLSG